MRASDLQLLALAFGVGTGVALLALRGKRRRLGAGAVGVGVALAWQLDRAVQHAVPEDALRQLGPRFVGVGAVVAVAVSAWRLPPSAPPAPPPVLLLAGASLAGVWVGVPETSAALLGAGVLGGIGLVAVVRRAIVTRGGAVAVALVPVVAALVGAAGNRHALAGGLLCSATVVLVGFRPPRAPVAREAVVLGTAVHLASALVAARHVGVGREWGAAWVWIALSLALAAVAAAILRRRGH